MKKFLWALSLVLCASIACAGYGGGGYQDPSGVSGGGGATGVTDGGAITYVTNDTDDFAVGGSTSAAPFYVDESAGTTKSVSGFTVGSGTDASTNMLCVDRAGTDVCFTWNETSGQVDLNAPIAISGSGQSPFPDGVKINSDGTGNAEDSFEVLTDNLSVLLTDAAADTLAVKGLISAARSDTAGNTAIYGGIDETDSGYFQVTGIANTDSPGRGSGEFVIRELVDGTADEDSKFAIISYDGVSDYTARLKVWGGTGHVSFTGKSSPVLSSCGTSPTIVGNDIAGKITVGTSASDTCTATFVNAWINAPACTVIGEDSAINLAATTTTSALVITAPGATDFSSDVLMYHCLGRE